MNDKQMQAQEELLAVAHSVIGERINDRLPGANDDAQAEYNEERLIVTAREFAAVTREISTATGHVMDGAVMSARVWDLEGHVEDPSTVVEWRVTRSPEDPVPGAEVTVVELDAMLGLLERLVFPSSPEEGNKAREEVNGVLRIFRRGSSRGSA